MEEKGAQKQLARASISLCCNPLQSLR